MFKLFGFLLLSILLCFTLLFNTQASSLERAYLFLGRMQVDVETEMTLMFVTESDFVSGSELTLVFLSDIGEWCLEESSLNVIGISSSPVDLGSWSIEEALPSTSSLEAICIPGDVEEEIHDRIVVENVGELDSGVSYGLFFEESSNFTTSSLTGNKKILVELDDGENTAGLEIYINLMGSDGVNLLAFVSDVGTITCNISETNLSFGNLPRDGSYITKGHTLSTESSLVEGYYWAVYGLGDGENAGLWKSTLPTSLIPSTGSTTINLSQDYGFGLNVTSSSGTVVDDFDNSFGVFGAIDSGSANSRLIFYEEAEASSTLEITLGAKAGGGSLFEPWHSAHGDYIPADTQAYQNPVCTGIP